MKICPMHWEQLRHAIKVRGLWDLVCGREIDQTDPPKMLALMRANSIKDFNPLLFAAYNLYLGALRSGGQSILEPDEQFNEKCPCCEAQKHGCLDWIDKAANGAADRAKEIGNGKFWCRAHRREATHTDKDGRRQCDPKLGGIMIPCDVFYLKTTPK